MGSPRIAFWEAQWVEKQWRREVLVLGQVGPQDRSTGRRAAAQGWFHRRHSVGPVLLVVTSRHNFRTTLGPPGQIAAEL